MGLVIFFKVVSDKDDNMTSNRKVDTVAQRFNKRNMTKTQRDMIKWGNKKQKDMGSKIHSAYI